MSSNLYNLEENNRANTANDCKLMDICDAFGALKRLQIALMLLSMLHINTTSNACKCSYTNTYFPFG